MPTVSDIFNRGPDAVLQSLHPGGAANSLGDMDIKELADICWTRASSVAKVSPHEARNWAKAALAGYDFLCQRGNPLVAESANENAAALRSWKLLA
jgi:hypothetical protein